MARKSGSHSDITGPRIRGAAERLIARHGFAAVSMRQIAAEVGVQVGALYLYTPDKQTLLFDLMREHLEGVLAAWDAVYKPADPLGRLQAFTLFHIRYHLDRPDAVDRLLNFGPIVRVSFLASMTRQPEPAAAICRAA